MALGWISHLPGLHFVQSTERTFDIGVNLVLLWYVECSLVLLMRCTDANKVSLSFKLWAILIQQFCKL